jgi:hypothetical protein
MDSGIPFYFLHLLVPGEEGLITQQETRGELNREKAIRKRDKQIDGIDNED